MGDVTNDEKKLDKGKKAHSVYSRSDLYTNIVESNCSDQNRTKLTTLRNRWKSYDHECPKV